MPNRLPELTQNDAVELLRVNIPDRETTSETLAIMYYKRTDLIRATYALAESRVEAVVREAQREVADAVRTAFRTRPTGGDGVDEMLRAVAQFAPPALPTPTCDRCTGPMFNALYANHQDTETCIAHLAVRVAALEWK